MSVLDGTSDLENTSASFQYLVCFSQCIDYIRCVILAINNPSIVA